MASARIAHLLDLVGVDGADVGVGECRRATSSRRGPPGEHLVEGDDAYERDL